MNLPAQGNPLQLLVMMKCPQARNRIFRLHFRNWCDFHFDIQLHYISTRTKERLCGKSSHTIDFAPVNVSTSCSNHWTNPQAPGIEWFRVLPEYRPILNKIYFTSRVLVGGCGNQQGHFHSSFWAALSVKLRTLSQKSVRSKLGNRLDSLRCKQAFWTTALHTHYSLIHTYLFAQSAGRRSFDKYCKTTMQS